IAFVGLPAAIGLIVTAKELVRLVYGANWTPVVTILVWLGIAVVLQPIQGTTSWLYVSKGRSRSYFFVGVVCSVVTVAAFFLAIPWGPRGIAAAYALVNILIFVPTLLLAHHECKLSLLETWKALRPIAMAAVVMGLVVATFGRSFTALGVRWQLVL